MKFLAEATIQGIDFTFERRRCGKDIYKQVICSHRPSGIGWSNVDKYLSTRIGVCREFGNGDFTVDAWINSEEGKKQIHGILAKRQAQSEKDALDEKAGLRPGDSISQGFRTDIYSIRVTGLTRTQALRAYKAAISVIGSRGI